MQIVVATHFPPVPGAPSSVTTFVSPAPVPDAEVRAAVAARNLEPIQTLRPFHLVYPPAPSDPQVALDDVALRYRDCERCHLSNSRTKIVYFRGNPYAPVVLVGEGPGRDEDTQGLPFVGRSGRLQDVLLQEAGIDPNNDVGWINLVGCRPTAHITAPDRPPSTVEKIACSERTLGLLRALRPRVLLCLGAEATQMLWTKDDVPPMNTWMTLADPNAPQDWVRVGIVRHPAYLLRVIAAPNSYREYAAARLFYRDLREMLTAGLQKVAAWPLGLRYLVNVQPAAGS